MCQTCQQLQEALVRIQLARADSRAEPKTLTSSINFCFNFSPFLAVFVNETEGKMVWKAVGQLAMSLT